MRSAAGTKSGEPCWVTRSTKATMAFLGAVSFHDGSGSWARPGAGHHIDASATAATRTQLIQTVFMGETSINRSAHDDDRSHGPHASGKPGAERHFRRLSSSAAHY